MTLWFYNTIFILIVFIVHCQKQVSWKWIRDSNYLYKFFFLNYTIVKSCPLHIFIRWLNDFCLFSLIIIFWYEKTFNQSLWIYCSLKMQYSIHHKKTKMLEDFSTEQHLQNKVQKKYNTTMIYQCLLIFFLIHQYCHETFF